MGNFIVCFGAPKKGSRQKLSLPYHPVCKRYAPPQGGLAAKGLVQQVAPTSAVNGGISCHGCKDMHTVASAVSVFNYLKPELMTSKWNRVCFNASEDICVEVSRFLKERFRILRMLGTYVKVEVMVNRKQRQFQNEI